MAKIHTQNSVDSCFSDKKSERAKDLHLLKRLTTLLKSRELEPGEMEGEHEEVEGSP